MSLRCFFVVAFILFTVQAFSQSVNSTPLKNMLCKKWVLDKLEDNGAVVPRDADAAEFDMIFNQDGTVQQGMFPDGLITGNWVAHDDKMTVDISDISVSTSYSVKILRLSEGQLIVQYPEGSHLLTMYYHPTPQQ